MAHIKPEPIEIDGMDRERAMRGCDYPGCTAEGMYRAPRSRDELTDYFWFCLDHVRHYNSRWNFFSGMSQVEIDAFRRADVTGHRPTWPVNAASRLKRTWAGDALHDLFGLFGFDGDGEPPDACARRLPADERDALAVLNLDHGATHDDIKARFKELVKRHHPDVNGGDKTAEEHLKVVIEAYRLMSERRPA